MSKILLHSCCGPCTTYVNRWLCENDFQVTSLFYNPNIRPEEEFQKRLSAMRQYAAAVDLKLIYSTPKETETAPEVGNCQNCYEIRLTKAAATAKKLGYQLFSTTLLVSPYQKHELIKELGIKIGDAIGVKFFYNDFRIGFRQSQAMAKSLGLYRQKYCGCKEGG